VVPPVEKECVSPVIRYVPENVADVNVHVFPGTFASATWLTDVPSGVTANEIVPLGLTFPV
jgi:hypothetical protein